MEETIEREKCRFRKERERETNGDKQNDQAFITKKTKTKIYPVYLSLVNSSTNLPVFKKLGRLVPEPTKLGYQSTCFKKLGKLVPELGGLEYQSAKFFETG